MDSTLDLTLKLFEFDTNESRVWLIFQCAKTSRVPEAWMLGRAYEVGGGRFSCHVLFSDMGGPKEDVVVTFQATISIDDLNQFFDDNHHAGLTKSDFAPSPDGIASDDGETGTKIA